MTGLTAGGSWTYAKIGKVTLALACESVRDKAGSNGTVQEVLDPEDGVTPIAEITASDDFDSPD